DAIVHYQQWIDTNDNGLLVSIAAYNEEDCRATLGLLNWLHGLRPADLAWPQPSPLRTVSEEAAEAEDARQLLRDELLKGAEPGTSRWLAAELLEYHRREARPAWWWMYMRCQMSLDELVEDGESIGRLEPQGAPRRVINSLWHRFSFPPQQHKLAPGDGHVDPATGKGAGTNVGLSGA